ncbi:separin isoform X2 [Anabrus simplex]
MDWLEVLKSEEEPNIDDQISNLQNDLDRMLSSYQCLSGPVYRNLHRLLAKLKLDAGDELQGISHLVESHGVSLRIKLKNKLYKMSRKPEKNSLIAKEFIEFKDDYHNSQQSLLKRLEELPQEWTVLQISCAHAAQSYFADPKELLASTPTLHITRMECGPLASQSGHRPFCITIQPPSQCVKGTYRPLYELDMLLESNKTDRLLRNRALYWSTRRKVDSGLETLVSFLENSWLQGWKCLLVGKFVDQAIHLQLENAVNKILKDEAGAECDFETLFPPRCRQILYCAARNVHHCNSDQLSRIVATSIGEQRLSPRTQRLTMVIKSLSEEFSLWNLKKHPVILIIDERLDSIPWEKIDCLAEQPITRIPSLHILQGLYDVHRSSMVNGVKIIPPSEGFYIVNPDQTLQDSENRMREFLLPRVPPTWSGTIGSKPSTQDFEKALHDCNTFVYMGHGSGTQFFSFNSLQRGITSTSLLFGCNSARLNMLGGDTESDGRVLIYPCQASPCVMGMLWEVTDRDTDALAKKLLDAWLPKKDEGREEETVSEPDLLRAMNLGRQATRYFATSAALVARGLPVKIQL